MLGGAEARFYFLAKEQYMQSVIGRGQSRSEQNICHGPHQTPPADPGLRLPPQCAGDQPQLPRLWVSGARVWPQHALLRRVRWRG